MKQPKIVTIGTPAYGGQVTSGFATELAASVSLFQSYNMELHCILLTGHSVIQMARNRVLREFLKTDSEMLVWIDSDISWNPMDLLKLCLHDEEVVGATYRKKVATTTEFTVQLKRGNLDPDKRGLLEVDRIGTGFLRVTRKALEDLTKDCNHLDLHNKANETHTIGGSGKYQDSQTDYIHNVFEVGIYKGEFLSEDFIFCEKLKEKGYKIMMDTKIDLGHEGPYTFRGSISHFLNYLKETDAQPDGKDKVD
jgi:hypothetical protein